MTLDTMPSCFSTCNMGVGWRLMLIKGQPLYVTVYDKTRLAKIAIAIFINSTTLELTLLQI